MPVLTSVVVEHARMTGGEDDDVGADRLDGEVTIRRGSGEAKASTGSARLRRCQRWRRRGRLVLVAAGIEGEAAARYGLTTK